MSLTAFSTETIFDDDSLSVLCPGLVLQEFKDVPRWRESLQLGTTCPLSMQIELAWIE